MSGDVAMRLIRGGGRAESLESIWKRIAHGLPNGNLEKEVRQWRFKNLPNLYRGLRTVILARSLKIPCLWGELYLSKFDGLTGRRIDFGLASLRVVTTAGVGFIIDAFQALVELETMKYHGIGTGTGAETADDTDLGTELTTEYSSDNTRATGSLAEGATANIFKSVGTNTLDSGSPVITEYGLLSNATVGSGVLLDRSVFSAINLNGSAGDSLQSTYQFTLTAGS